MKGWLEYDAAAAADDDDDDDQVEWMVHKYAYGRIM